jgi:hypothetical protein
MQISLTKDQISKLENLAYKARKSAEHGKPGCLLAQIWIDDYDQAGFMVPKFVGYEDGRRIQNAIGVPVGSKVEIIDGNVVIGES